MKNVKNAEKKDSRISDDKTINKEPADGKKDSSFYFAVVLFGSIIIGTLILILKAIGLF